MGEDNVNNPGYVYVLITPQMEGLVKVGRTERDPQSRAKELSAATGVPTPFFVAYDTFFEDCIAAEKFIHASLEFKGHRLTNNKEFFQCPPNEAIKAVIEAQSYVKTAQPNETLNQNENEAAPLNENLAEPWKEPLELGLEYYYGKGEVLQDYEKALKYLKQALNLGSPEASVYLGDMYKNGAGAPQDLNEALTFYEKGSERGNKTCFAYMALLYHQLGHIDNALKCWEKYFTSDAFKQDIGRKRAEIGWERFKHDYIPFLPDPTSISTDELLKWGEVVRYIDREFYKVKDEIIAYGNNVLNYLQPYDSLLREECTRMLGGINKILQQECRITITEVETKGFKRFLGMVPLTNAVTNLVGDAALARLLLGKFPASFEVKIPEDQISSVRSKLESAGAKITIERL
jgi:tetratricopeptide (TPR) repeat protein